MNAAPVRIGFASAASASDEGDDDTGISWEAWSRRQNDVTAQLAER